MERYNIYCSEEVTYKAAALGAPLKETWDNSIPQIQIDGKRYRRPTTEQITGFLRERGIYISITATKNVSVSSVNTEKDYYTSQTDPTYDKALQNGIKKALEILQKKMEDEKIKQEMTEERREIMDEGRPPFCGNSRCWMPRTRFNGEQFKCPQCGWTSSYEKEFIDRYKEKWNKDK